MHAKLIAAAVAGFATVGLCAYGYYKVRQAKRTLAALNAKFEADARADDGTMLGVLTSSRNFCETDAARAAIDVQIARYHAARTAA